MPPSLTRVLLICCLLFSLIAKGSAQSQEQKPGHAPLYRELYNMDSLLFAAFNTRDLASLRTYFATDLELYQDNVGVRNYEQAMEAFKGLFSRDYVLTRELVKGSMEVYPIKDFGAIQTGLHTFSHVENGKLEKGTFKFMHVWQQTKEGWKIKRLITYDH
jgi:hypothetical protein